MAKPETRIARVRRYCLKVIERAEDVLHACGRAYFGSSGWEGRRDTARRILKELDRG